MLTQFHERNPDVIPAPLVAPSLKLPQIRLSKLLRSANRAGFERLIALLEGHIKFGCFTVEVPGGERYKIAGSGAGPEGILVVRRWRTIRRLFAEGAVGFADAYLDGDWDSPDLAGLIEMAARNRLGLATEVRGNFWSKLIQRGTHAARRNSRVGSRRNIASHYDLGNSFYESWLDATMTYSSAIFPEGNVTLEEAQKNKYRRLLDVVEARQGDHILEIGGGWGGFAECAASERGVRVTSITLSREQLAYSRRRVAQAGLESKVDVQLRDYRDIEGSFDHIVSIEMLEAVGEAYWPTYFDKLAHCLRPGGRVGLQVITIDDEIFETYRSRPDFIQTHVFPGGMLPSMSKLREQVTRAGLTIRSEDFFADHYARTLALWRERFDEACARLNIGELDERFRRFWRLYLSYCEGGFRAHSIDVVQAGLQRI